MGGGRGRRSRQKESGRADSLLRIGYLKAKFHSAAKTNLRQRKRGAEAGGGVCRSHPLQWQQDRALLSSFDSSKDLPRALPWEVLVCVCGGGEVGSSGTNSALGYSIGSAGGCTGGPEGIWPSAFSSSLGPYCYLPLCTLSAGRRVCVMPGTGCKDKVRAELSASLFGKRLGRSSCACSEGAGEITSK